ncbi:conserved protein, unknown function [Hepatocystis sp. ex Piliocolobus tephrosceles]|nr:conserved protein, unknown function [Hepatocystis sp. ex Piliocolobus tephrosceles]
MISPSDEHNEDDRRSCIKYFVTLLFLLLIILMLRKEKEEEELNSRNKVNLRQNENNRTHAFNYLKDIDLLKYDSVIYISPNRKIVPSLTYISEYIVHVEGYDNILHNFDNLSLTINEINNNFYISAAANNNKNNNKNYICNNNENSSDNSCATINTILVSKNQYKNVNILSCQKNNICFFVFVQLKKNKCYNFNNLSHSCHLNNTYKSPNIFLIDNYCYIIIASPKIQKVYEFIQTELLGSNKTFNENTKSEYVDIVTHFCGNVLNQIANIDPVNGKLLFMQQYIHKNYENKSENESDDKEHIIQKNNEQNEQNEEYNNDNFYDYDTYNKQKNKNKSLKFQINYYLTIINLASDNKDIIEYIDYMKNKQNFNVFPPIYIGYHEVSNFYYIVQHENNGCLTFIFISASNFTVYYVLKIRDFYSGWLLNSNFEFNYKGLVLFGEYPPYEDELHVWDIVNFQHKKYMVNVIKSY